jgi:hypothetical protein
MRMLVSVEFADAGKKLGTHRVLIVGPGPEGPTSGDIGLSLEEAKTLISDVGGHRLTSVPNPVRHRSSGPHLSEGRFRESTPQAILRGAEIPGRAR